MAVGRKTSWVKYAIDGEPERVQGEILDALAAVLDNPRQPAGVPILEMKADARWPGVDHFAAVLPHGYVATFVVHEKVPPTLQTVVHFTGCVKGPDLPAPPDIMQATFDPVGAVLGDGVRSWSVPDPADARVAWAVAAAAVSLVVFLLARRRRAR